MKHPHAENMRPYSEEASQKHGKQKFDADRSRFMADALAADDGGWTKHTPYHWSRFVGGKQLDYWPSRKKYQYEGQVMRGDVQRFIAKVAGDTPTDDELRRLRAENEALRGLKPEIPQRPPHNNDASHQHPALPRYGLRWNGPGQPVSVPMADGYWTPFHLALAAIHAAHNAKLGGAG